MIDEIEEIEENKPFDLVRNQYGGIDGKIENSKYGIVPVTLEGILLERAENGEFGEIK